VTACASIVALRPATTTHMAIALIRVLIMVQLLL